MRGLTHAPGDKVRVKPTSTRTSTLRGTVSAIDGTYLIIRASEDGSLVRVKPDEITNFSLAARKAWQKMPERQVGRPRGSTVCDRVSVTIRLDRDLWEQFREAESRGYVTDRTNTLNTWVREGLNRITPRMKKAAS